MESLAARILIMQKQMEQAHEALRQTNRDARSKQTYAALKIENLTKTLMETRASRVAAEHKLLLAKQACTQATTRAEELEAAARRAEHEWRSSETEHKRRASELSSENVHLRIAIAEKKRDDAQFLEMLEEERTGLRKRVEQLDNAKLGLELDLQGWAEFKLETDAAAQEHRTWFCRVLRRSFCRKRTVNVLQRWSAFRLRQKALRHRALMVCRRSFKTLLHDSLCKWSDTGPPLRPPPQPESHAPSRQNGVLAEASAGTAPAASKGAYLPSEASAASTESDTSPAPPPSNALQAPPPDRPPPKPPTQAHEQATSPRVPQVLKTNPISTPFPSLAAELSSCSVSDRSNAVGWGGPENEGSDGTHEGVPVLGSPAVPALNLSKLAGIFFGGALDTPRNTGATSCPSSAEHHNSAAVGHTGATRSTTPRVLTPSPRAVSGISSGAGRIDGRGAPGIRFDFLFSNSISILCWKDCMLAGRMMSKLLSLTRGLRVACAPQKVISRAVGATKTPGSASEGKVGRRQGKVDGYYEEAEHCVWGASGSCMSPCSLHFVSVSRRAKVKAYNILSATG